MSSLIELLIEKPHSAMASSNTGFSDIAEVHFMFITPVSDSLIAKKYSNLSVQMRLQYS